MSAVLKKSGRIGLLLIKSNFKYNGRSRRLNLPIIAFPELLFIGNLFLMYACNPMISTVARDTIIVALRSPYIAPYYIESVGKKMSYNDIYN